MDRTRPIEAPTSLPRRAGAGDWDHRDAVHLGAVAVALGVRTTTANTLEAAEPPLFLGAPRLDGCSVKGHHAVAQQRGHGAATGLIDTITGE